jgi:hypothetical protein
MSEKCRYCCKSILPLRARNFDSSFHANAQRRFKSAHDAVAAIRQISSPFTGGRLRVVPVRSEDRQSRCNPTGSCSVPGRQSVSAANPPVAYECPADARGPRATSGQGRAYSAARDDIPHRPALSANNWRARCTISKPQTRDLTLHSKTADPSKCSYPLIAPIARCFISA